MTITEILKFVCNINVSDNASDNASDNIFRIFNFFYAFSEKIIYKNVYKTDTYLIQNQIFLYIVDKFCDKGFCDKEFVDEKDINLSIEQCCKLTLTENHESWENRGKARDEKDEKNKNNSGIGSHLIKFMYEHPEAFDYGKSGYEAIVLYDVVDIFAVFNNPSFYNPFSGKMFANVHDKAKMIKKLVQLGGQVMLDFVQVKNKEMIVNVKKIVSAGYLTNGGLDATAAFNTTAKTISFLNHNDYSSCNFLPDLQVYKENRSKFILPKFHEALDHYMPKCLWSIICDYYRF
jgi:hypothetical protein